MNNKFNRKKVIIFRKRLFLIPTIFILFILIGYFTYINLYKINNLILNSIENLSHDLNYTLKTYVIEGTQRIKKDEIEDIIKPNLNKSIFLLPLKQISNLIYENNWVKKVKLNTDYQNKIFIEIEEYEPIGIYKYNDRYYYFNLKGKIIEYASLKEINDNMNFIIFAGKSSIIEAENLLIIIDQLNKEFRTEIINAAFIENRRWNLLLKNNLLLKLSENYLKRSLENFLILNKNLAKDEFDKIESIDLRNYEKAIIKYK